MWRTILQVSKGKEKILSKEIFIECGIFQGDSLSPTLFGLAFIIIIIYHQTDEAWVYTRATRQ